MSFILVFGVCVLSIFLTSIEGAKTRWHEIDSKGYNHELYMVEYDKHYESEAERLYRKNIFDRKLFEIKAHNKKNLSWKEGVNQFTDRTPQEMMKMTGFRSNKLPQRSAPKTHILTGKSVPSHVDYRKTVGILTGVKDQGDCGSCWAVSSASTVESHWNLATGLFTDLSIQQIASCTNNPRHEGGYGGCHGGFPDVAFESIIDNGGLATQWTYPYSSYFGQDHPCIFYNNKTKHPLVQLSSYVDTKPNNYEGLMDVIANVGPISILVDARDWEGYESGIFDNCNSTVQLDHAVQLVGYGSENGADYWIVRNSWGPTFGEGGFIRIIRQARPPCDHSLGSAVCGACGIIYYGSYPIIQKN